MPPRRMMSLIARPLDRLVFSSALAAGLLNWDDPLYLTRTPPSTSGWSLGAAATGPPPRDTSSSRSRIWPGGATNRLDVARFYAEGGQLERPAAHYRRVLEDLPRLHLEQGNTSRAREAAARAQALGTPIPCELLQALSPLDPSP